MKITGPVKTALFVSLFCSWIVRAELTLPKTFGDHMVLQAGKIVPIWGHTQPGEHLQVSLGTQSRETVAGNDGKWRVEFDSLAASEQPAKLSIMAGAETRTFSDVLVGENWLCSGQSNMEKPLGIASGQKPVLRYQEEIQNATRPSIRFFKVERQRSAKVTADLQGTWTVCSPDSIERIKFSAVAYFFGRKLNQEMKIPVGLIESSWSGTRIEAWMPPGAAGINHSRDGDNFLYNGMIHPLAPFALRGILWYQGEQNIVQGDNGQQYLTKFESLIKGWRQLWGSDLPFYYVRVAPFLYHVARSSSVISPEAAPRLEEGQAQAARLGHAGMVVITDLVDDLEDIHPRNKVDVGERLARWALHNEYGHTEIEVSGPVFERLGIQGGRAVLHFEHVQGGLASRDKKPLTWFTVAGKDGGFYPGIAKIEGNTVIVSSPEVPVPAIVRFGWDEAAEPNLVNGAGLPAVPFRTDSPLK